MKKIILVVSFFLTAFGFAQEKFSGLVTDATNTPLAGVSVQVKGSTKSTSTDFDGKYTIVAKQGDVLKFTYVGLDSKSVTINGGTLDVQLSGGGEALQDVVILGTRNPARTVTESAVPIDVIAMKDIATQGAQANLNQIMNMVAPSFTSNAMTVADGTDHIDPAQLRGLGPDQVLVLVNGKRRHSTSLVNINGSPGRGSVGTDLNALPAFAIDRIEVLRDGASAQYGSDAIAGVINLNVKKATNKLEVNALYGSNVSQYSRNFRAGNDGNNAQIDLNYGFGLGKEKSFINATASFQVRDITSRAQDESNTIFNAFNAVERVAAVGGVRLTDYWGNINNIQAPFTQQGLLNVINQYAPGAGLSAATVAAVNTAATNNSLSGMQTALGVDATASELRARGLNRSDVNMRIGQSSLESAQFFLNGAYPISEKVEAYAFGGYSQRNGDSAGFYRKPNAQNVSTGLFPNGFLPEIHSRIRDISFAGGLRGKILGDWNFDLSNTTGQNQFGFQIENTANATLRNKSNTSFDAGALKFFQNTTNFDLNKKYDKLNLAFGAEFRKEQFDIVAGEPDSYNIYDINGGVVTTATPNNQKVTNFFGAFRAGGSQVFPGYRNTNALSEGRTSVAGYADAEYEVTDKWLVNGAIRFENFSDFGSTLNYKLATRYKIADNFNLRGAIATGFRAPSLHQIYFNNTSTQFANGVPQEVVVFNNSSAAAKAFGVSELKQEESMSFSAGFTAKIPAANLTVTADVYQINIKDRVTFTDRFDRPATAGVVQTAFDQAGAQVARFFANALDTESKGIDVVISHKLPLGKATLKTDLAATYSQTRRVGDIKGSPLLIANGYINKYYNEETRIYLEEAIPREKGNLTHSITLGKVDLFLRNVYFGSVTDPNVTDVNGDGFISARIVNGQALEDEHPTYGSKIITDFSVSYAFTKNVKFIVGANNILDIYPDFNSGPVFARRPTNIAGGILQPTSGLDANGQVAYQAATTRIDLANNSQFAFSRNVSQFGQNGRFIFARLNFKF